MEGCKYYLFTVHELLDGLRPLVGKVPQKIELKLAEIAGFVNRLEADELKEQLILEHEGNQNELKGY